MIHNFNFKFGHFVYTGVEVKFKNQLYSVLIDASHIQEMRTTSVSEDGVCVGSSVSLSHFTEFLKVVVAESLGKNLQNIAKTVQFFF